MPQFKTFTIKLSDSKVVNFINKIPIFDKLQTDEVKILIDYMRYAKIPAGEMQCQEGDELVKKHPRVGINILKGIATLLSTNLRKTSRRLADYMMPVS